MKNRTKEVWYSWCSPSIVWFRSVNLAFPSHRHHCLCHCNTYPPPLPQNLPAPTCRPTRPIPTIYGFLCFVSSFITPLFDSDCHSKKEHENPLVASTLLIFLTANNFQEQQLHQWRSMIKKMIKIVSLKLFRQGFEEKENENK